MRNILLIRIPPAVSDINSEVAVQWGQYSASGELNGGVHVSTIASLKSDWLAQQARADELDDVLPDQVILLISGGLALHRRLSISTGQRKHLSTALPFLIEEDLAQDIDSVHIASFLERKTDQVNVSAIPHVVMQELLALFDEQGLLLDRILVEGQFLEEEEGYTTLLLDQESIIMGSPDVASVCLDYDSVKFVLLGQQKSAPEESVIETLVEKTDKRHLSQIRLVYSDGEFSSPFEQIEAIRGWLNDEGWLVDETVLEHSVFEYFSAHYFSARKAGILIDLRQGAYQCPRKTGRQIRRWKPAVAVAACWFVLELGLAAGQAILYQQKTRELWQETMNDYLAIFPNDQQAKNAKANQQATFNVQRVLENRLRSAGKKQTGEPFLPLLQKVSLVSDALDGDSGFEPQSMDFNDSSGQLVLEFQAGSLEAVDQLLEALKNAGLTTKLDSANQGKTGVLARMTIGR